MTKKVKKKTNLRLKESKELTAHFPCLAPI